MKQAGTSELQSYHSKKPLPRKAENEAVPKEQISDPSQLGHMLSLASTKKKAMSRTKVTERRMVWFALCARLVAASSEMELKFKLMSNRLRQTELRICNNPHPQSWF